MGKQIHQGECRNGVKRGVFQKRAPPLSHSPWRGCAEVLLSSILPRRAHGEPAYGVRFFPSLHASHGRLVEIRTQAAI